MKNNNYKDKKEELEDIRETLFDTDFVILRCLLKCAFDEEVMMKQGDHYINNQKDEKTKSSIVAFLESNNLTCKFVESLLSNLRDPNYYLTITTKEQPTEVLREDREDTWFICSYIKKLSLAYLKDICLSILVSLEKEMKKSQEELNPGRKNEILIELCTKFIKKLFDNLHLLPKNFFNIFAIIKRQYKTSSKDAIISIFFLRILYLALLTPEKFFREPNDKKSDSPRILKKRTVSLDKFNIRNSSAFVKIFKLVVTGIDSEEDPAWSIHKEKINELNHSINTFIEKISESEKLNGKVEKIKSSKKNKHIKEVMMAIKKYQDSIEIMVNNYTPFKITPNSPIGHFLTMISINKSFSSLSNAFNNSQGENIYLTSSSSDDKDIIEDAPILLGDTSPKEDNSPTSKIKATLRNYEMFESFKKFLENEHDSEPLELYSSILKYKRIDRSDEKKRSIFFKNTYANFIDPKGKHSISLPVELREKFTKMVGDDLELLQSDEKLINDLLSYIYVCLYDHHRRFLQENFN